jgi:hypothetical protein
MGRRIEKVKVDEIIDAERLEEQDHVAKVHPLNLRNGIVLQLVLIRPGCVQSKREVLNKNKEHIPSCMQIRSKKTE